MTEAVQVPEYKKVRWDLRPTILSRLLYNTYVAGSSITVVVVSDPRSFFFKGNGKTSYALRSVAAYYKQVYDYNDKMAWYKALDSTKFLMKDIIEYLKNLKDRRRVVIADDAGFFIPRKQGYEEEEQDFFKHLEVFRPKATAVIFTATSLKRVPGPILDNAEYIFYISRLNINLVQSVAECWTISYDKSKPWMPPVYKYLSEETFPTRYPTPIWKLYNKRRIEAHYKVKENNNNDNNI